MIPKPRKKGPGWTPEMIDRLRREWPADGNKPDATKLAAALGKTYSSARAKASRLGLCRSTGGAVSGRTAPGLPLTDEQRDRFDDPKLVEAIWGVVRASVLKSMLSNTIIADKAYDAVVRVVISMARNQRNDIDDAGAVVSMIGCARKAARHSIAEAVRRPEWRSLLANSTETVPVVDFKSRFREPPKADTDGLLSELLATLPDDDRRFLLETFRRGGGARGRAKELISLVRQRAGLDRGANHESGRPVEPGV